MDGIFIIGGKMTQNNEHELLQALIKERRSERRWKNIRFILGVLLILFIIALIYANNTPTLSEGDGGKGYVALVRLSGLIAPDENFSAEQVTPILRDAFKDKQAKGVILDIDSGGGTPVQASIIHDMIVDLKNKYHKKVIVVGEDMLASGAYFVAVSADKIYVNPNTLTGSIGVIMKGFGFPELIKHYGVERRVYTAGQNKDRLDPFLPQNPEDIKKITNVINEVHQNFIQTVIEGRKGKIDVNNKEIFSGDFWSGETALKLGLVDGLGNLQSVMQNEFQVTRYKDYSGQGSLIKNIFNQMGASFGTSLSNDGMKLSSSV